MRLNNVELIKLLPAWLRNDGAAKGLTAGSDAVIKALDEESRLLSRWNRIDELDEATLDKMAWELNILWYDGTSPIEVKRDLIKNSDKVYAKLGTKFAVRSVAESFFKEVDVQEWFEYGGQPYQFRIIVYSGLDAEQLTYLMERISYVKNSRSHLESILVPRIMPVSLRMGIRNQTIYIPVPIRSSKEGGTVLGNHINVSARIAMPRGVTYRRSDIRPSKNEVQ